MSHVLLGWEYGGGHGHVRTLLPIARALAERGHKPVFAVREVADVWPVLRSEGFPVLPAPFWPSRIARLGTTFRARTFADIMSYYGWGEPDELEGMVRAWDSLIDFLRPALVVMDHAPGLSLATWKRIPTLGVGTGFTNPPPQLSQYPVLDHDAKALLSESALKESIEEVQRRRGQPAPAALASTLGHGKRFVTVFPEVDPYTPQRIDKPVGPLTVPPLPLSPPPSLRWFGYLNANYPGLEKVLLEFAATGVPGEVYIRGAAAPLRETLRAAGVHVHDQPARMSDVLPRVSVVIHHGGIGLTGSALAAGRPQLCLPEHLEQRLTAALLARIGVSLSNAEEEPSASMLKRILKGELYMVEAQECAASIRRRGPWEALPGIVQECLRLIGG